MKTEVIRLRATESEKVSFQDAAELSGLALSAWVRERLRHAAIRELEGAGRQVAFIEQKRASDA